uniref:Uncharacterized protein n=1 Tax=Bionectria ochroleuca TaxID=29856 RepID=A0A8H7NMU0_BIOOC
MTPQQIFNMRSQGGFNDQMPPGITNQTNLFQSQGHNRQSSRFNFANESGSSVTNIKLSANPRIMAQQSSMMPNSFQSQGNQYYASSMPGPPPGLKSTGTPKHVWTERVRRVCLCRYPKRFIQRPLTNLNRTYSGSQQSSS